MIFINEISGQFKDIKLLMKDMGGNIEILCYSQIFNEKNIKSVRINMRN